MQRFRGPATLQKFLSAHAAIRNHFNLDRRLTHRTNFRQRRDVALVEGLRLVA